MVGCRATFSLLEAGFVPISTYCFEPGAVLTAGEGFDPLLSSGILQEVGDLATPQMVYKEGKIYLRAILTNS